MGFAVGDIARTEEDSRQVTTLIQRLQPSLSAPTFGGPDSITYIVRDEDDRNTIHGLIHVERAWEVKHFLVDPDYKYQKASATLLHRGMEMNMRISGISNYYVTVPREDARVIDIYRKDGAEPIDTGALRFMKRL